MTILDEIRAQREKDVAAARATMPEAALERRAAHAPIPPDFAAALRGPGGIKLIAEIKRASPSAGLIREDFDPAHLARQYSEAGAAAISVLTEPNWFQGSLDDLLEVRETVHLPLLRKDFLSTRYQILEARAAGAAAVLLIVAMLSREELRALLDTARETGLATLVEVHDRAELDAALAEDAAIIGINNRDLKTMTVNTETTFALRSRIPPGRIVVSESGIRTRDDMRRLQAAGVDAALVGESLMRQPDPGIAAAALLRDGSATVG